MSDQDQKKNWFVRHKIITVILVIILIAVVSSSAKKDNGSGGPNASNGTSKNETKQYRFADRADKQDKDTEVLPNEVATISGVKMTVIKTNYTTNLSSFETAATGKTYLVADVTIENTSNKTQPYNTLDFRVQTAGGQVLDGTFGTLQNALNSGDLVAGGKVSGQVLFELPEEVGHQYIIWKPSFNSERAIVQVK